MSSNGGNVLLRFLSAVRSFKHFRHSPMFGHSTVYEMSKNINIQNFWHQSAIQGWKPGDMRDFIVMKDVLYSTLSNFSCLTTMVKEF